MKKVNRLLLLTMLLLRCTLSSAQEGTLLSDLYLKGKWTAECPEEIMNRVGFRLCELCPFVSVSKTSNLSRIKEIDLDFGADSLTLNQNGITSKVPYTRDKDNHSITFFLKEKQLHFRVFIYGDQRILEDEQGLLMVLTKAD